ncbi:MAG TPA: tetratricopeptide repeat protein [Solirubrobacteraceae bacterium]|nr:tetratricopeptide repeat protein [Solirubrobacteraceae bacterium]
MPVPRAASVAAAPDAGQGPPAPSGPSLHPRPPSPRALAHADASQTAQLAGPAVGATQLGMPPGITVAPATAPAPLQSADAGVGGTLAAEPDAADAVALPRTRRASTGGPDVLAGWAWSTGSIQAIPDEDDFADTARAGRRRLVIAIGSALAVVATIVVVALAFGGSEPAAPPAQASAGAPGRRATSAAQAPTAKPISPPAEPPAATASQPRPEAPGEPPAAAPSTPPPAEAAAAPSTPPPAEAVAPPGAPPAAPPATESPGAPPAATRPATESPSTVPSTPPPPTAATAATAPPAAVAPAPPAAAPPPTSTPAAPAAPPAAAPPNPQPPATAPPRAAAALPDAAVRKPEAKKPEPRATEPKAPARVHRTTPTTATTKAQPIDPYASAAAPETKPDPSAAYRAGLQQYARGDNAGALATLRASASASPGYAPTWRGLGLVYEKLGNRALARLAFKRYLQLAPDAADTDQIRDRMERLGP